MPIYLTWMDALELMFLTEKQELRTNFEKFHCLRDTLRDRS